MAWALVTLLLLAPGRAFAFSCAMPVYSAMAPRADIVAHVRVVTVNPADANITPERMRGQYPAAVALEVLKPMRGAVEGQRLVLLGGVPGRSGPDLSEYPRGSEWVLFMNRHYAEEASGVKALTPFVDVFPCARSEARVRDGWLDLGDFGLQPSLKEGSFHVGSLADLYYFFYPNPEEEQKLAKRLKMKVEDFALRYLDLVERE